MWRAGKTIGPRKWCETPVPSVYFNACVEKLNSVCFNGRAGQGKLSRERHDTCTGGARKQQESFRSSARTTYCAWDVFWGRQILQKNALFKTVHFQYVGVLKNEDFGSNQGYPLSDHFFDIFLDLEKHFVAILVVSCLGSVLAPLLTNLLG